MRIRGSVALFMALTLAGCATKGPLDFGLESPYVAAQTAVIRPATKEEKTEPKANLAVRIFVNPTGRGSIANLVSIARIGGAKASADLSKYGSVRVSPGEYQVEASCSVPSWSGYFSVMVEARPGKEYLLECLGNTAHTMKLKVLEHIGARATSPSAQDHQQRRES